MQVPAVDSSPFSSLLFDTLSSSAALSSSSSPCTFPRYSQLALGYFVWIRVSRGGETVMTAAARSSKLRPSELRWFCREDNNEINSTFLLGVGIGWLRERNDSLLHCCCDLSDCIGASPFRLAVKRLPDHSNLNCRL